MCYCDSESPEFFNLSKPTAKKSHYCCECRRMILVGEQYERASGKWDGCFETYKTCSHCVSLREYMLAHFKCFCLTFTNLHEDTMEFVREYASQTAGLFFGAYRFIATTKRMRKEEPKP